MRPVRSTLIHVLQGLLMGTSDVIPGVSGGTMALIVGIYRRLIEAISSLFSAALAIVRLDGPSFWKHFLETDWRLILPLGFGIATAIIVASAIIPGLLERYPHQMRGLFFGLVTASIAVPWLRIGRITGLLIVLAFVAAVIAFFVTGIPALMPAADPSLIRVFLSASIAICAMILPGVSGAFLLEVMGIYQATLEALRSALTLNGASILYVLTFMLGAAIGLGTFAKLLNLLLSRFHDITMAVLIGLMAGALRALWPWLGEENQLLAPGPADPVGSVVILLLAGFAFVAVLTWLSADTLRREAQQRHREEVVQP